MFARLGRAVVSKPWLVIAAWIVAAVVIIATAPRVNSTTDESDALPRHYESIKAADLQEEAFPSDFSPSMVIVYSKADGGRLTRADEVRAAGIARALQARRLRDVDRVLVGPASPNREVMTAGVEMPEMTNDNYEDLYDAVRAARGELRTLSAGSGLEVGTTGTVAQEADVQESSGNADAVIAMGTIGMIFVLLLIIFRSPVIALLPLLVVALVSGVANGLINHLVDAFGMETDPSVSSILIVVLFGVGTDYILFLMFRYRERLRLGEDKREAMVNTVDRTGEAIASAATVVVIAFLAMTLSTLGFFKSMGPSLAIAVAVTLLAGLTLVPAIVSLLGPKVFWPSKSWQREPRAARFTALGGAMSRHPGRFAAASGLFMVGLALLALNFNPTFDLTSGSLPDDAPSVVATRTLERGFPSGATEPTDVYVRSTDGQPLDRAELDSFGAAIGAVDGVGDVTPPIVSRDGEVADYSVTLDAAPESDAALDVVKGPLRSLAGPDGTEVLVGGITSVYVDIQAAMDHDYAIVFPVAALLIVLVLGLLLRSVVAPLYLIVSVGIGFLATLGATTLLFKDIQGERGLVFMLPLIMYMFVVALGTDYNILMTARLREEARDGHGPREALARAIQHTGPTVASAGVILAGSFAALMLANNSFMSQIGFALAFGILVAAFAMATFFTPSITALLGRRAWWPGHGGDPRGDSGGAAEAARDEHEAAPVA
jgi:putative drug exporter of the RND superfamily